MTEKLYISKRIVGATGRFDYYLTENDGSGYGVEIHQVETDGKTIRKERVDNISLNCEKVLEFLYMLSDMEVMPVHLKDIVNDLVNDDFFIPAEKVEKIA